MTANYWLVVGTCFIFPYIGNNHPNWRTHIFQRGRLKPPASHVRYEMPWNCEDPDDPLNPLTWQVGIVGWRMAGWLSIAMLMEENIKPECEIAIWRGAYICFFFWLVSPFLLVLALWWHAFYGYGAEHATYRLCGFSMCFTNPTRTTAVSNTQSWLIV